MAQTVTLERRVTDPLGGTINGAVVTLNSPGTPRTTRTGADGTFAFEAVPVGSVNLDIEAPGFESSMQTVSVTGNMSPLSLVLKIAGVVESVGVVAPKLEKSCRRQNLFDSDYATAHGRAFADVGGPAHLTSTLGVPRTLHVSYTLGY
jgi:hypothetical protein